MTPFTITTNNIRCLGVTLTKQVKDLYDRNFKSLKIEIKEDLRSRRNLLCFWIGSVNIEKWPSFQKKYTDSMQCPTKP